MLSDDTFARLLDKVATLEGVIEHALGLSAGELPVSREAICRQCDIPVSTFDHYRSQIRQDGTPVLRSHKFGKQVLVYPSEFAEDLRRGIHPGACAKIK